MLETTKGLKNVGRPALKKTILEAKNLLKLIYAIPSYSKHAELKDL